MAKHASSLVSLVVLALVGLGMLSTSACTWVPEEGTTQEDTYCPPTDVVGGEDVKVPPDLGGPDTGEPDVETTPDADITDYCVVTNGCDDGDPCTIDECDEEHDSCSSYPKTCADGDDCTADACVEGECTHEFNSEVCECLHDSVCDDGDLCNGAETCVEGECLNGTPIVCDDGEMCVDGLCEEVVDCTDADSDDYGVGQDCSGEQDCDDNRSSVNPDQSERCGNGFDDDCDGLTDEQCGPAPECAEDTDCDDENPCTTDICSGGTCTHEILSGIPCEDGDACTVDDECKSGVCMSGAFADCDDLDPRTTDSCDSTLGCVHEGPEPECATDSDCNDGNVCTLDVCSGGNCAHMSIPGCGQCVPACAGRECGDDGCGGLCGTCAGDEACVQWTCVLVDLCEGVDCADDNLCTHDECVQGACVHTPIVGCGEPAECGEWGAWIHGLPNGRWRMGIDETGTNPIESDLIVLTDADSTFGSFRAHSVWAWFYGPGDGDDWGDSPTLPEGLECEDRCGNLFPPDVIVACDEQDRCEQIAICSADAR